MPSRDAIAGQVRALLSQVMDVAPDSIGSSFDQASCDSWSSLTHLMLISELESRFGVSFSNQEITELTSYDRIVDAIARRAPIDG